ncbi:MAG: hypothetical protein K5839_01800 [Treponemataceae bacterium]|nr:hypothetical protein [Treponemataceae bacterium]
MNEDLMIQLMQEINNEHIQHGSCEIKFTFHDGRIQFYEFTSHKRINVADCCGKRKDGFSGTEKSA